MWLGITCLKHRDFSLAKDQNQLTSASCVCAVPARTDRRHQWSCPPLFTGPVIGQGQSVLHQWHPHRSSRATFNLTRRYGLAERRMIWTDRELCAVWARLLRASNTPLSSLSANKQPRPSWARPWKSDLIALLDWLIAQFMEIWERVLRRLQHAA